MKNSLLALVCGVAFAAAAAPKGPPPIISMNTNDLLLYGLDEHGNRVPDFSTCGYAGGDKDIPNVPVQIVVAPVKGDETARIQRAIDHVAGLPADANGVRGAVLLLKGTHEVLGGLLITNSGVVLRGQGIGESGTLLVAAGLDRRTLIRLVGKSGPNITGSEIRITDDYVPVGATSFHVSDAASLKAGDSIRVVRPCTKEWIDLLGANEFGGGEGGGWKPGSHDLEWDRVVKSVSSNLVTVDAPITTALEKDFGGGSVEHCSWPDRITNVGIENLQLESTYDASNAKDENHSWCAITMENTADAWVRQVTFKHFAGSAVAVYETCQRVTVEDCMSLAPVSEDGGYRRNTFFTMGQQTLFLRCLAEHGRHDFSVGNDAAGPNAFVQCEANEALADSGGIESWSSGTLFDLVRIDGNAITLGYRAGNNGSIGWAAANSVLWNCSASMIRCWNPPGAQNWSFGSWGGFEGDGFWRDSNGFRRPESFYAQQLAERTKRRASFMSRSAKESTNPSVEEAAALIAASHKPAPQLSDFIAAAKDRNPIPADAGSAKSIDSIPAPKAAPASKHTVSIVNGWIVCDGKLLVGGQTAVAWWRGSIRPEEAPSFEPALTRFVPGRIGRGLTDDIDEVADEMVADGDVAMNQHYGLWYDLRRDDHERVRRMTGDVLPPFFEQPFARSGEGLAWDGLSKYDLTKFNPWYWSRLKTFADVADERGLLLLNQNYFQHNIIEAGAHWVDGPWRTANNINSTGFPEPPPFAGDKRIFMAEQFYDETNPARRALQQNFIRQNLDNFTNNANVIQFTSAEFTGPLHFVQFWLDTIGDWEQQHESAKPMIALSTTKDVQDAILADPKRAAVVDIIAFRYWWMTDKGVYAPKGGLNLSPRQFQRLEHPGNANDLNLAMMAAEYRGKFPAKAVVSAGEQGNDMSHTGWAFVCAGGSMPNISRGADAKLLAAIPRMLPWKADNAKKLWALREAGKQMLVYAGGGGDVSLDLSGEAGNFRILTVSDNGQVTDTGETVAGRSDAVLKRQSGQRVFWLTKE